MNKTNLASYNNSPFYPGGNLIKRLLWYYVNVLIFKSSLFPIYGLKNVLLRLFGAKLGNNIKIKPCVNIKYPWNLNIGNDVWIGENVWIDNLVPVIIGNNVCLSQGATLLTGNHNYNKTSFDLLTGTIILQDGVWIGAFSIINSNITVGNHAVVTSGAIATKNMDAYGIYQGNPAVKIRQRIIK